MLDLYFIEFENYLISLEDISLVQDVSKGIGEQKAEIFLKNGKTIYLFKTSYIKILKRIEQILVIIDQERLKEPS